LSLVSGQGSLYEKYLGLAAQLGLAIERDAAAEETEKLNNGDGESLLSLDDLRNAAERIRVFEADEEMPASMEAYGIAEDNPFHVLIEQLLDRLDTEQGKRLVSGLAKAAKADAQAELEVRLSGLDIFSAASGAEWYFRAKGLGYGIWDFAGTVEERLVKDTGESSALLLEKRLELEIEALRCFLEEREEPEEGEEPEENEEPEEGEEPEENEEPDESAKLLSFFCTAGAEDVQRDLEILSALRDRLLRGEGSMTNNDEENALIRWFVSGGSHFVGAESELAQYYGDYRKCVGLLELYQTRWIFSAFAAAEAWAETVQGLRKLFGTYGIDAGGSFLPDIETAGKILLKTGFSTAACFLKDFDARFSLIPDWLADELGSWKNSLIEYTAAEALYRGMKPEKDTAALAEQQSAIEERYNSLFEHYGTPENTDDQAIREINRIYQGIQDDESVLNYLYLITLEWERIGREAADAAGEKHWRQYLDKDHLGEADPAIRGASSIAEGILLDALYTAKINSSRTNDALTLYAGIDRTRAAGETADLLNACYLELGKIRRTFDEEAALKEDIFRLGRACDYSKLPLEALEEELVRQQKALREEENNFDEIRAAYFELARNFSETGKAYDDQYTTVKAAYNDMEQKRFLYETQDAIRRWAGSAYLENNDGELNYCKTNLDRAGMVLTVLSDLYNDGEERRPYDNPKYETLYNEYRESFRRVTLTLKAGSILDSAIYEELQRNEAAFASLKNWIYGPGKPPAYSPDYVSPAKKEEWSIKDVIAVKNGLLAFSPGWNVRLGGVSAAEAAKLSDYFKESAYAIGTPGRYSAYEKAVIDLCQRMDSYLTDTRAFRRWGLARDYLVRQLINADGSVTFLKSGYKRSAPLHGGALANLAYKRSLVDRNQYIGDYVSDRQSALGRAQQQAWAELGAAEKADLEFYLIITLFGNGDSHISGFSQMSALWELETALDEAQRYYDKAAKAASTWYKGGAINNSWRDLNRNTRNRIKTSFEEARKIEESWERGLTTNKTGVQWGARSYLASCANLAALRKDTDGEEGIGWDEINHSLLQVRGFTENELDDLRNYWERMRLETGGIYRNVPDGLAALAHWAKNLRDENTVDLENQWIADETGRQEKEQSFWRRAEIFIAGGADIGGLRAAARRAFGQDTAAVKAHLENLERAISSDLSEFPYGSELFANEYKTLGTEYVSLVSRMYTTRYRAELAAREAEWDQQRLDIAEKFRTWTGSAALRLERGREDWKQGKQRMEEAYRQWAQNYQNEYNKISGAWAEACLAGLEEKKEWLEEASAAAGKASSGAFLAAVGAGAEQRARALDTRDPLGITEIPDVREAEEILGSLLNTPGINSLADSFRVLNGIAETSPALVRRGLGGSGNWDTGIIRVAAADMARNINGELAAQEAKKLARSARSAINEAVTELAAGIDRANGNFRRNMDELFIIQGSWRRKGKKYIKDIVVGSTLFESVITEEESVDGYADYRMEPVSIKTNLDENYLAGLNAFAVQGLIKSAYEEINAAAADIFGGENAEKQIIKKKVWEKIWLFGMPAEDSTEAEGEGNGRWVDLEDRELNPGKFGAHIGYGPVKRPRAVPGKGMEGRFYDQGSGELGRLMTQFMYWSDIDNNGLEEVAMAPWEKPMWDSDNSPFIAPSLRTFVDVANQAGVVVVSAVATPFSGGASAVGMAALMAGVSVTDDLIFGALDTAGGYKALDEAGFEFAKVSLVSTASSFAAGAFGGVAGAAGNGFLAAGNGLTGMAARSTGDAMGKVIVQAGMTGLETATTGMLASAINGITYDHENGLAYSLDTFHSGVINSFKGSLASMASVLTGGALKNLNSGMNMEKLAGFSRANGKNLDRLNGLIGSIAGQGVNFALGDDFTVNILNTGLFSNGMASSGLLELRLGRDGVGMNFGSGGANVSPDNLAGAVLGAMVWNVNNRIDRYTDGSEFREKASFRALYGFGDKQQREQMWDILDGRAEIRTEADEGYTAKTEIIDGKRIVKLGGYTPGLSVADQMFLAAVLGHEAYRDGYKPGDIDQYGNILTETENFDELKNA
ncbi:MAG: hypothetical protein LBP27_01700, partial [Treponema sp.]|nr:hypothetical protein [Treponema sp.]